MRNILFGVLGCLVAVCAHAAQVANLDYVHKLIQQKWDISIPIKADNPMLAANMKYLLTAVDVANEILNGEKTTDYGNGEYATLHAADTVATIQAVNTLVQKVEKYKFTLTTTPDTSSFSFSISAAGEFVVDWGDGTVETKTKPNTTDTTYSHNYTTANTYTIGIGGQATAYNTDILSNFTGEKYTLATISFSSSAGKIASIDGSLGAIFGTLTDGTQPGFYQTFSYATNMTSSIPENLFAGITGAPTTGMFNGTFYGCSGLTSIPAGLFAGISGAPTDSMFSSTFYGCSGLTSIPDGLFAGISGTPANYMFSFTFGYCGGLTSIPAGLFAGISGAPADSMFSRTFFGCSKLTSIPENLFGNISGTEKAQMFEGMFWHCTSLTGPSARINGQYLYEIWPNWVPTYHGTYTNCTGLSDYSAIPNLWKNDG